MGVQVKGAYRRFNELVVSLGMSLADRVGMLEGPGSIDAKIEELEFTAAFTGAYFQTRRDLSNTKLN
jgi:hypothetical protein